MILIHYLAVGVASFSKCEICIKPRDCGFQQSCLPRSNTVGTARNRQHAELRFILTLIGREAAESNLMRFLNMGWEAFYAL